VVARTTRGNGACEQNRSARLARHSVRRPLKNGMEMTSMAKRSHYLREGLCDFFPMQRKPYLAFDL
jgi:hypothetical protein